jgi:pantothenate kinase
VLQSFDELLALAEAGDHRSVDMLVKDIYGGDYSSLGLRADIIASSFGKATRMDGQLRKKKKKKKQNNYVGIIN